VEIFVCIHLQVGVTTVEGTNGVRRLKPLSQYQLAMHVDSTLSVIPQATVKRKNSIFAALLNSGMKLVGAISLWLPKPLAG
jgi:hypothetical protein